MTDLLKFKTTLYPITCGRDKPMFNWKNTLTLLHAFYTLCFFFKHNFQCKATIFISAYIDRDYVTCVPKARYRVILQRASLWCGTMG